MKVLVQRCSNAKCVIDDKTVSEIDNGLMLLVGFTDDDNKDTILRMVKKVLNLRIFPDKNGVMNLSVLDVKGSILSISQFTLYADTTKGNRPSYIKAMGGEKAKLLYEYFNKVLNSYIPTKGGVFGADMEISLTNMGPTTIMLER
jgi:D-tyrosyl-tRNA(Tyr) deacylase